MNIRKLILPTLIAAALATPALAQQQDPPADAAKRAQAQDSRGKAEHKADGPKAEGPKLGKKDKDKADPTREPEEEDER